MIAKRYLALLTGVAMATSTVAPANAVEADQTVEITANNESVDLSVDAEVEAEATTEDVAPAAPVAEAVTAGEHFTDVIRPGVVASFDIDAPGRSATTTYTVYGADHIVKSDSGWTVTAIQNKLSVTAPLDAAPGDYVEISVTRANGVVATATLTVHGEVETPAPTLDFAISGGIEPGGSFDAPNSIVPADAVLTIVVTDKDGKVKANDGWTAVRGGTFDEREIKVTAPQTARKGDIAVVTATHEGRTIGTVTVSVQNDGEIPLGFDLGGDVLPGVESTWDVTVAEGAELNYYVVDVDGNRKAHENWDVTLVDGVLSVKAPANAREGDRVIITAHIGEQVVGKANLKVAVDGIQTDLRGDILAGTTTSWPTSIAADAEINLTVTDAEGNEKSAEGYSAEIRDGELHITVPANATADDRVILDIRQNDRTVGKADLRVVTTGILFDIRGDVLAGEESFWDGFIDRSDFNAHELTVAYTVVDSEGNEKSIAGWDVELNERGLFVTPPADAEEGDRVVISARDTNNNVRGSAVLRVIAKADESDDLVYDIFGDVLPGEESYWDNIELPDHQPKFTVVDADGNEVSTDGWKVTFEDGTLRVTAPDTARKGDVVTITSENEDGETVGKARLRVVVDGANPRDGEKDNEKPGDGSSDGSDGSSEGSSDAPWWAILVPILGVAGVIALLTGGSSLSSGSSANGSGAAGDGSTDGSTNGSGAGSDNGGTNGGNGNGAAEGQTGGVAGDAAQNAQGQNGTAPATGPVGGQDAKAAAQAQAANAPAYTPKGAAAAQQQPTAQQAQVAESKGYLANTGVQNTLIALVIGLLATAAGVLMLLARRRNI